VHGFYGFCAEQLVGGGREEGRGGCGKGDEDGGQGRGEGDGCAEEGEEGCVEEVWKDG